MQGSSLALDKVEAVFTNPPATLPSAEPDLTVEFSQGVFSDMTSHLEEFGAVKSGGYTSMYLSRQSCNVGREGIQKAVLSGCLFTKAPYMHGRDFSTVKGVIASLLV